MMRTFSAATTLFAAALLATPALAVTAVRTHVGASALVEAPDGSVQLDTRRETRVGIGGYLFAFANARNEFRRANISVEADWKSAVHGDIAMNWAFTAAQTSIGERPLLRTFAPVFDFESNNWDYSFVTGDKAQLFTLQWTLEVEGPALGLGGLRGSGGLPDFISPAGVPANGSGTIVLRLDPNTAYRFGIRNEGLFETRDALNSEARAFLTWTITDAPVVPEPATWALFVAGFGAIGAAARRKAAAAGGTPKFSLRLNAAESG